MRNTNTRNTKKLLPVSINGKTVKIDPSSINTKDITTHHGMTATGTQVNSADSTEIGNNYIIWPSGRRNGSPVSINMDDFEVMATKLLERRGFTFTKGDTTQTGS